MMCEMCGGGGAVRWYLVDANAEMELHGRCAKELRREVEVEPLNI